MRGGYCCKRRASDVQWSQMCSGHRCTVVTDVGTESVGQGGLTSQGVGEV